MNLPLQGINVLSVARLLPGAYCTRLLADLGASVIMVEHPVGGDPMRLRPGFFSAMNRNKKSITLDLKTARGKEICYKLSQRSDVFLESFRPGVASKLGIDYDTITRFSPQIIYSSISGYGQFGPYRGIPGHDLMYQGITGMLSDQIAREGNKFVQPLVPIADLSSAMFAAISILASLYDRKKSNQGDYLDISMADGLASWMSIWLESESPLGQQTPIAGYGVFQTKDGQYVALGIDEEQHFWRSLCTVIGRDDLAALSSQERRNRYQELDAILKTIFKSKTSDEWVKLLVKADVPISPAYTNSQDVMDDPQLNYRKMVLKSSNGENPTRHTGSPLPQARLMETRGGKPPELGQHNQEILTSLGYSPETIKSMKLAGEI